MSRRNNARTVRHVPDARDAVYLRAGAAARDAHAPPADRALPRGTPADEYRPARGALPARAARSRSSGDRGRPLELAPVSESEQPVLLFPADDAVPITQFTASERPVVLIVPDGSWRQASKMRKRVPGLEDVPCVTLPDAGRTQYRLRAEVREGGLATFEAIARALCYPRGRRRPPDRGRDARGVPRDGRANALAARRATRRRRHGRHSRSCDHAESARQRRRSARERPRGDAAARDETCHTAGRCRSSGTRAT